MSRYVIKFSKEGTIRYISHLDLLRLFKRSFKRVGVKLQYSQGFNPHPKMSFAQPLSLGYSSTAEYIEFDTIEPYSTEEILRRVRTIMPEGIEVTACEELPAAGKTLAALTEHADYEMVIPLEKPLKDNIDEITQNYISRDQILVMKHQRKSGKDIEVDIKPMISSVKALVYNNDIVLTIKVSAGSSANLSPEIVLSDFCAFAGVQYDRAEVTIKRTELYFQK